MKALKNTLQNALMGTENGNAFEIAWTVFRFYMGISIALGAGFAKVPTPDWFVEQVGEIGFTYPSPAFWAHIAVWGEFAGGLLIALGLFTRLSSIQLAFHFLVVSFVWYQNPEFMGMYYQQLIFWAFVLIAVRGGGKYSADYWLPKIKWRKVSKAVAVLALLISTPAMASDPINGNGKVKTETKVVEKITRVQVETYCNVTVKCGAMPRLEIPTDENIFEYLEVKERGGTLVIDANGWIEPTQIHVTLYTPYIHEFSNSGWGNIRIEDLQTEELYVEGRTGHFVMTGEVEKLKLKVGTGTVNAIALSAKEVFIDSDGHGNTQVMASEFLEVTGGTGNIRYEGEPTIENRSESKRINIQHVSVKIEEPKIEYVEFTLVNNSNRKRDFYIYGPPGASFSYGFPMKPGQERTKIKPVGTEIYLENWYGGKGSLVLTITKDMQGKTLSLFQD
jgi:uncharacterized membrane protein YphA (DoxX/SURF4 family)